MRALLLRAVAAAACAGAVLAGCKSADEVPSPPVYRLGALFVEKPMSSVSGGVRLAQRDDGVAVALYAKEAPGSQYRLVVHARGNCSSPNLFSAGPPWAPPGVEVAVLIVTANTDSSITYTGKLKGYKLEGPDGLVGRSIVLHEVRGSLDAQPDVPNSRLACGVIEERAPSFNYNF
jgi:Cu-Zn family superoxide dismutase